MALKTIDVLGVPVACATYETALETIKELASENRPSAVCPSNTHILAAARHDSDFAETLKKFDVILPDGMPVVWALNAQGARLSDRVYGPLFMRYALERTGRPWRHFLFGDTEECLVEMRAAAQKLCPEIDIVGSISPPFRPLTEEDQRTCANIINEASPHFIWVALPGVRMENWIMQNQARFKGGVFLAVGDAFTLLSGRRPFAPRWMQRAGLTWLFRLLSEPRRLASRYFRYNSLFLMYLIWDGLRGRRSRLAQ